MAGQDPEAWPRATLREAHLIVEAAMLRDARIAWQQAQYHRFAVHRPNEMPEQPELDQGKVDNAVADEIAQIRRRVKLAFDTERAHKHGR